MLSLSSSTSPFTSKEGEITSGKEENHSQESNDTEEFRKVVKRMASASGWKQSLVSVGSQSSKEQWTQATLQRKRKEMPHVFWDLVESTWHKNCRGSTKQEEEV